MFLRLSPDSTSFGSDSHAHRPVMVSIQSQLHIRMIPQAQTKMQDPVEPRKSYHEMLGSPHTTMFKNKSRRISMSHLSGSGTESYCANELEICVSNTFDLYSACWICLTTMDGT